MHIIFAAQALRLGEWRPDRRDRALHVALGLSVVLHGVLLSLHFKFPEALRWKSANAPLEVVLVNTRTRERPTKADVLAQANLDRGGNVDQRRRAKTPLPVTEPRKPGKGIVFIGARRSGAQVKVSREITKNCTTRSATPISARDSATWRISATASVAS